MRSVRKQLNRKTDMDWSKVDGARQQKRTLILRESKDKTYTCPVKCCENRTFFSKRGCRKHVDTKHRWYYYFDEKPSERLIEQGIKQQQSSPGASKFGDGLKKRADTTKMPYYSISSGIGKKYIDWLCAVCGGGMLESQATQNGIRVMKFLKHCSEDDEDELSEEHIDYCIGSAQHICKFIEHIGKEWGLGSSAQFGYLQAITDLIDFRKSSGLSATVLGNLAVSEVYINRGKRALARRKLTEWSKNLSVEVLAATNQWATMDEMEKVIPYHLPRYKVTLSNCKGYPMTSVTAADLSFATRFVAVYLFTRVKGSRPMTYQYLTIGMMEKAKENGGFVDQTEFKTAQQYSFDSLIFDETSTRIVDDYIMHIRPLLNPQCDYVLVTRSGTQIKNFSILMSKIVFAAIGKYVHPTRYRQILETESSRKLSVEEQDMVSRDQKHSSQVARTYYQKRSSREIATHARRAVKKLQNGDVDKELKKVAFASDSSSDCEDSPGRRDESYEVIDSATQLEITAEELGKKTPEQDNDDSITSYQPPVRQGSKKKAKPIVSTRVPFTPEEDYFLKKCLKVYGFGKWTCMLRDPRFKFHEKRTSDSLKKRAEILSRK